MNLLKYLPPAIIEMLEAASRGSFNAHVALAAEDIYIEPLEHPGEGLTHRLTWSVDIGLS